MTNITYKLVSILTLVITVSSYHLPVISIEPFVVLEYSGNYSNSKKNINSNNPFLRNYSHNEFYEVKEGDSLSGIINKFYSRTGLNKKIIEISIIQINKKAFVKENPHYLYAGKKIKIPSINEIMNLVKNDNSSSKISKSNHIYFFGGN
tara:strand:- start:2273 stop:2719 length:447 start_codon:yes stop_codon:yes gene_type:complete